VKFLTGRARHGWIIHKEVGISGMDRIKQAQDMGQWMTIANVATNPVFYKREGCGGISYISQRLLAC
jgi:hypothetical protein